MIDGMNFGKVETPAEFVDVLAALLANTEETAERFADELPDHADCAVWRRLAKVIDGAYLAAARALQGGAK